MYRNFHHVRYMFPVFTYLKWTSMQHAKPNIITVSKQEVHNRNRQAPRHRLAVSNNVKSQNVTPPRRRRCQDGIGEATSHNQTWQRRDVMQKSLLVNTSDQSITPELYCSLSLNQLIQSPSCHSLELHLSTNTSRQCHHIQHNTYKNSKTLIHTVTIVIYNNIHTIYHTRYLEKLSPLRIPSFCGGIQPW